MADVEPEIGPLLVQICRAQRNLAAAALDAIHIHVGQENLVYRLAAEEGVSQTQLAGALCLDASTVTKMLLRLERDGVVERRVDADDARILRVYLTPHGKALVQPVLDVWRQLEARITQGMSEAELLLLRRLLLHILSNLS
ncbi:MAG TPA: MarR family transcriptional regulator [Ktedonobacterales bacterium]|nr:MarR family transcriptional regulator [Ktedonobacterales bacterium]